MKTSRAILLSFFCSVLLSFMTVFMSIRLTDAIVPAAEKDALPETSLEPPAPVAPVAPTTTVVAAWTNVTGILTSPLSARAFLFLSSWVDISDEQIKMTATPPFVVQEATSISCGHGIFVVVGGYDPSYTLVRRKLQIFRQGRGWISVDLPKGVAETHHGATCVNSRFVYILSGQLGPGCSASTTKCVIFDVQGGAFSDLPSLPEGRYAPGVTVTKDGTLHVFGGAGPDRREPSKTHWVLDLNHVKQSSWRTLPTLLPEAGSHGFVFQSADGRGFFYGGFLFGDARMVAKQPHDIGRDCQHSDKAATVSTMLQYLPSGVWTVSVPMKEAVGHFASMDVGDGCFFSVGGAFDGQHASSASLQMFCQGDSEWHEAEHALPMKMKGGHLWVDGVWLHVSYFPWTRDPIETRHIQRQLLWRSHVLVAEPLFVASEFSRYHVLHPLGGSLESEPLLPVIPVLLNLEERTDRLRRMTENLAQSSIFCFVRFEAVKFKTLAKAQRRRIIDHAEFLSDIHGQKDTELGRWMKAHVRMTPDELYMGHSGVKVSMLEMFRLKNLESLLKDAACRHNTVEVPQRPLLILEDDSMFVSPTWLLQLKDALSYLEGKQWHILMLAFRDEEDWDDDEGLEDKDLSDSTVHLPAAIRLKKVLGNTAMVINPALAPALVKLLDSTPQGGLSEAGLDWVVMRAIEREVLVVYRTRERLVAPFLSMSSIHGSNLKYSDTHSLKAN